MFEPYTGTLFGNGIIFYLRTSLILLVPNLIESKSLISVQDLKRLLIDLKEQRPEIAFRYRLLGEMWCRNGMKVIHISERGVMFNDEINSRLISIYDLSAIMQFELDMPFHGLQAYYQYHVMATE